MKQDLQKVDLPKKSDLEMKERALVSCILVKIYCIIILRNVAKRGPILSLVAKKLISKWLSFIIVPLSSKGGFNSEIYCNKSFF